MPYSIVKRPPSTPQRSSPGTPSCPLLATSCSDDEDWSTVLAGSSFARVDRMHGRSGGTRGDGTVIEGL
ncbi:hypothetical protein P168DRAFT_134475 [Aspergillus campestris IBT 28561]|uniref:Uncharacterized protein n=1 Tax=Aspergillus campestris (strain IBT 28561) TaxID=1392248 RepID=A0A2I1D879_ASPC2|nr:uncharacterized protein P168DRAFT_134475 [Aspergillus campestris IBT 28561]PKY06091.1 hypothetical protein P168DRAFT_134475 [Aspergillus campestris IBT 28561]